MIVTALWNLARENSLCRSPCWLPPYASFWAQRNPIKFILPYFELEKSCIMVFCSRNTGQPCNVWAHVDEQPTSTQKRPLLHVWSDGSDQWLPRGDHRLPSEPEPTRRKGRIDWPTPGWILGHRRRGIRPWEQAEQRNTTFVSLQSRAR